MIYDTKILICKLPDDVGVPICTTLEPLETAYCGEMAVYHKRFWEAVQAGSRVEKLVQLPLHRNADAGMFVQFKGHVYSIEQAQFEYDENQLPCTILSLKRPEGAYDIAGI